MSQFRITEGPKMDTRPQPNPQARMLLGFFAKRVKPGSVVEVSNAPIQDVFLYSLTPLENSAQYTIDSVHVFTDILPLTEMRRPMDGIGDPRQFFIGQPFVRKGDPIRIRVHANDNAPGPVCVSFGVWAMLCKQPGGNHV